MDMKKRIIRVFPTKTNATPTDELVRIRETPSFFDEADEVHESTDTDGRGVASRFYANGNVVS